MLSKWGRRLAIFLSAYLTLLLTAMLGFVALADYTQISLETLKLLLAGVPFLLALLTLSEKPRAEVRSWTRGERLAAIIAAGLWGLSLLLPAMKDNDGLILLMTLQTMPAVVLDLPGAPVKMSPWLVAPLANLFFWFILWRLAQGRRPLLATMLILPVALTSVIFFRLLPMEFYGWSIIAWFASIGLVLWLGLVRIFSRRIFANLMAGAGALAALVVAGVSLYQYSHPVGRALLMTPLDVYKGYNANVDERFFMPRIAFMMGQDYALRSQWSKQALPEGTELQLRTDNVPLSLVLQQQILPRRYVQNGVLWQHFQHEDSLPIRSGVRYHGELWPLAVSRDEDLLAMRVGEGNDPVGALYFPISPTPNRAEHMRKVNWLQSRDPLFSSLIPEWQGGNRQAALPEQSGDPCPIEQHAEPDQNLNEFEIGGVWMTFYDAHSAQVRDSQWPSISPQRAFCNADTVLLTATVNQQIMAYLFRRSDGVLDRVFKLNWTKNLSNPAEVADSEGFHLMIERGWWRLSVTSSGKIQMFYSRS